MVLKKAGANWVEGDRFFDREVELEALAERVRNGTHTLLTAQRRMGKTSLVRELLRRLDEEGRREATLEDVERVYTNEMLGVRGQMDMEHYEGRLKMVLGREGYRTALEILTEASVSEGGLRADAVARYREFEEREEAGGDPVPVQDVLLLLEHDGYLERQGDGYRFVSGLLEDWWRARHGGYYTPIERR